MVAWHNPDPEYMQAEIPGAVNVMRPPFFDPAHYRSDSNQHWRHGCPHDELATGAFTGSSCSRTRRSGRSPARRCGESMESFLDADRATRLQHLRDDRIDLS